MLVECPYGLAMRALLSDPDRSDVRSGTVVKRTITTAQMTGAQIWLMTVNDKGEAADLRG